MSSFSICRLPALFALCFSLLHQDKVNNLAYVRTRSIPTTPQNPHFSKAHLRPWSAFTASGPENFVKLASPGHNQSPYCALLAASSTSGVGGYASLMQDFTPGQGITYNISFAYKQTPFDSKADEIAYEGFHVNKDVDADTPVVPVGSITFGVLDPSEEAYLFAETVTMYPLSSGKADSLGNKPGVWHDVTGGQFVGNADEVSYAAVLEPGRAGMQLAVEVDDLVVKAA